MPWWRASSSSSCSTTLASAVSRQAERATDLGALVVGDGHRVRLGALAQLQAVLDAAQEAVGVGELRGVVLVDVAGGAELGERRQRRRRAQIGIEPAVDELQQLDGELDVTDAATAALHLAVGEPAARQFRLAAGLEVAHRPEVVGGEDP